MKRYGSESPGSPEADSQQDVCAPQLSSCGNQDDTTGELGGNKVHGDPCMLEVAGKHAPSDDSRSHEPMCSSLGNQSSTSAENTPCRQMEESSVKDPQTTSKKGSSSSGLSDNMGSDSSTSNCSSSTCSGVSTCSSLPDRSDHPPTSEHSLDHGETSSTQDGSTGQRPHFNLKLLHLCCDCICQIIEGNKRLRRVVAPSEQEQNSPDFQRREVLNRRVGLSTGISSPIHIAIYNVLKISMLHQELGFHMVSDFIVSCLKALCALFWNCPENCALASEVWQRNLIYLLGIYQGPHQSPQVCAWTLRLLWELIRHEDPDTQAISRRFFKFSVEEYAVRVLEESDSFASGDMAVQAALGLLTCLCGFSCSDDEGADDHASYTLEGNPFLHKAQNIGQNKKIRHNVIKALGSYLLSSPAVLSSCAAQLELCLENLIVNLNMQDEKYGEGLVEESGDAIVGLIVRCLEHFTRYATKPQEDYKHRAIIADLPLIKAFMVLRLLVPYVRHQFSPTDECPAHPGNPQRSSTSVSSPAVLRKLTGMDGSSLLEKLPLWLSPARIRKQVGKLDASHPANSTTPIQLRGDILCQHVAKVLARSIRHAQQTGKVRLLQEAYACVAEIAELNEIASALVAEGVASLLLDEITETVCQMVRKTLKYCSHSREEKIAVLFWELLYFVVSL